MRFAVLGPVHVADDRDRPIKINGPRPRAALAQLVLHRNRVTPMSLLVDSLWEGEPPPSARSAVQGHVKRLRQMLGDAGSRIRTASPGYCLVTEPGEVDLDQFQSLVARSRTAAAGCRWDDASSGLTSALALWRGDPLLDVPASATLRTEADRLTELYLQTLEWRVDADLRLGRANQLIPELRQLVVEHPLHERFRGHLMTALNLCGRSAEALDAYGQARAVLARELGVEPSPQLRAMHVQLTRTGHCEATDEWPGPQPGGGGAVTAPEPDDGVEIFPAETVQPASLANFSNQGDTRADGQPSRRPLWSVDEPNQLPPDLFDLVHREQITKLDAALYESPVDDGPGAVPVVLLTGPGGAGKTALAVHAAHRAAHRFPDGCLYVELGGTRATPVPVEDAIDQVLRALGVSTSPAGASPASAAEQAALLRSVFAGRRVLVVLDDAADADQVLPLLPGTRGSAAVVTSRASLGALDGSHRIPVPGMRPDDSARLLTQLVGSSRAEAEPGALAELAELCSHLPVALRAVGTRLALRPEWSVGHLVERLLSDDGYLSDLGVAECGRRLESTLRLPAVPECERWLLTALAVVGLRDVGVAEAAHLAGLPVAETRRCLEHLVDRQLLHSRPGARYRLRRLHHHYEREQLRAEAFEGQRREALDRLTGFYLAALQHPAGSNRCGAPALDLDGVVALAAEQRDPEWGDPAAARLLTSAVRSRRPADITDRAPQQEAI